MCCASGLIQENIIRTGRGLYHLYTHTHYKVWDKITHLFPSFNGTNIEVWEWIGNVIPYKIMGVITNTCEKWSYSVLVKASGRCILYQLELVIFRFISKIYILGISCEIALSWMPQHSLMISQYLFRYWLGAVMQQVITWSNVVQVLWRHMTSLSPNKPTQFGSGQIGLHFSDDFFKYTLLNENRIILSKISMTLVPGAQLTMS